MSEVSPEPRQLRALVALTDEGTFTDAAIRLGVTQSAVSRLIAALEAAVGVPLVERTTRSVALTDAGRRTYRAAVLALTALDDVTHAARGTSRPLRLGYSWAALGSYTSPVLREWRSRHPDVPLEVHRVDERSAGLTRGVADVAVVRGDLPDSTWASRLVVREPRLAALARTHELASRPGVTLADLRHDTLVTTAYGTTTVELWPADARPSSTLWVDNLDEWLTEIAGGLGIGVTAAATAGQHAHPGVVFVPLDGVAPIPVRLAWPAAHPHPAVERFVDLVSEVVAGQASATTSNRSV
ncbi:LysR family transcriptional regulator [Jatrophihabitans endophyticus]|uniref:LysR family transcriptional regulator n=1 Tax=Jatrophihabitans endophyticus TaxID=1206085 RepID=UPI0019E6AB07|nr:LysR family transcriptional regulator [Jatrophihabitans endophyticus]MBE7188278.1 LysR family transcriptional regulator [Jatrophihabitans endophyticus]